MCLGRQLQHTESCAASTAVRSRAMGKIEVGGGLEELGEVSPRAAPDQLRRSPRTGIMS